MALSAFDNKAHPPTDAKLAATLGRAAAHWRELQRQAAIRHGLFTAVWGYTSRNAGWGLRLKQGERVVLYLTPRVGCFLVSLALGEKATAAARAATLPPGVLELIERAPRQAEGRGVRFEVRTAAGVRQALALAALKLEG